MKKVVLLIIITVQIFAKLSIVVSIQPEIEFVQKIGGDRVDVVSMVEEGSSPHIYEPKIYQMKKLSRADLYFAIGVEFEKVWLDKFKSQNRKLKIIDLSKDINRSFDGRELDPHIWTTPLNVKLIAKNIFNALSTFDKNGTAYYKQNLDNYLRELDRLDREIRDILKDVPKGSSFMVFHPAWGYFARDYGLKELAVEINGKEPKPKELIKVIKEAKRAKVKAIFTQPEFPDKSARIIADTLKIKVIKVSPLSKDWANNLLNLTKAIAN